MKILFAVDLNEPQSVVVAVEALAERLDAELLVLHVYTPAPMAPLPIDPMTGFGDFAYAIYDPETQHNIEMAEEHEFHAFLTARFTRTIRPSLVKGDPATVILDEAAARRVDLIVLGKRHHGRLEKLLLGSVVTEVIEQAKDPVLLMPIVRGKR